MNDWKRIDAYHLRNGDWTICKKFLGGCATYELWHGYDCKGHFDSADDAIAAYADILG